MMPIQSRKTWLLACTLWMAGTAHAQSPRLMDDAWLDRVVAGAVMGDSQELARFEAARTTRRGSHIHVQGQAALLDGRSNPQALLILGDNAQQNLSSLININAVNSPVNVLLNLNVNIDSVVGQMQQINLQRELATSPAALGGPR
ncbi:hypothetical protein M911_15825 [Ectothiorhodospira haloalkaliphila]|uniref:Uncharacterized protein n=2 Tax=Ectothiorhodospiraceae TaxID=72276 RepID=W8KZ18_9GAMM|nr:hypothetical protein M911_15825 [Ectothiorhodospira haloalkaliphila]